MLYSSCCSSFTEIATHYTFQQEKKTYVWLGVSEKNDKAILFYKKNGFYEFGTHSFFIGEEEQTDFVMRKNL